MGNINCCCESTQSNIIDYNFTILIDKIYDSHPFKKYKGSELLLKFTECEKEIERKITDSDSEVSRSHSQSQDEDTIDNTKDYISKVKYSEDSIDSNIIINNRLNTEAKSTTKTKTSIKEYSQDKFLKIMESILSIQINDSNQNKRASTKKISKKFSSSKLIYESDKGINLITTHSNHRPINSLYTSIVPFYDELFEVIKNKPKSNFILYFIAFSNDNNREKSEIFIEMMKSADVQISLSSFQDIIRIYLLLNMKFCFKLLYSMNKNHSQDFINEINFNFGVKINNNDLIQWIGMNDLLNKNKLEVADRLSFQITNDLITIIKLKAEKRRSSDSVFNGKGLSLRVNTSFQRYNDVKIDVEDVVLLLQKHFYLFDASKLRKFIFDNVNDYVDRSVN